MPIEFLSTKLYIPRSVPPSCRGPACTTGCSNKCESTGPRFSAARLWQDHPHQQLARGEQMPGLLGFT